MSDPVFPPEIEHIISTYALALKARDESNLNLLLISKRFHAWLVPELMRTVVVQRTSGTDKYPWQWKTTILQKYGIHVQNLFLWTYGPQIDYPNPDEYLSLCPNVTNLVMWTERDITLIEKLPRLPLTHLSFDLSDIPSMTPELSQLFSKITHVDVMTGANTEPRLDQLKHFTSITHLAVPEVTPWNLLPRILETNLTLQVLILLDGRCRRDAPLRLEGGFDPKVDDPRIMKVTCQPGCEIEEWLLDVQKGRGMWGIADDAVRERKVLRDAARQC
ncbi:hypothetical protein BDN72DRAFT_846115 [Pluteus cervinus]|uniref:Uncharacterized protein n=1 Tax=Pluteus cervinus TaxID=181527 RepID=A0ACD3AJJ3_9AGAR|nr:hypothetical protein BDN72DRAFT_846115 [Pluteus cervinus]